MKKIQVMCDTCGVYIAKPENVESVIWNGCETSVRIYGESYNITFPDDLKARKFYEYTVGICYPKEENPFVPKYVGIEQAIKNIKENYGSCYPKA